MIDVICSLMAAILFATIIHFQPTAAEDEARRAEREDVSS